MNDSWYIDRVGYRKNEFDTLIVLNYFRFEVGTKKRECYCCGQNINSIT